MTCRAVWAACLLLQPIAVARLSAAAEVPWPSFLRTRPAFTAPVLQEVSRGATYRLIGCAHGWCQIALRDTTGYLPESALSAPAALRPDAGRSAQPTDCIGFLQTDRSPELLCRDAGADR